MTMKPTKADQLRVQLKTLQAEALMMGRTAEEMAAIQQAMRTILGELARLARARRIRRARNELLYDIHGHHGPA